jgi:hypothetical protein
MKRLILDEFLVALSCGGRFPASCSCSPSIGIINKKPNDNENNYDNNNPPCCFLIHIVLIKILKLGPLILKPKL